VRRALVAVGLLIGAASSAQTTRAPGPPLAVVPTSRVAIAADVEVPVDARLAPAADSLRPPDLWIARDKAMHASASFLLTLSGQYVLTDKAGLSNGQALPVSAATTLALGVLKEVADSRRARGPHFSWRDLAADAVGVALGALVAVW
jgi:uncharacterized protein YfiM (DUF2279 family)